MNKLSRTLSTVAAVATLGFAGTAAFAQEATYEYPQDTTSTSGMTLAKSQADYAQARANGSLRVFSTTYSQLAASKSVKTRAEVQAEVRGTDHADLAAVTGEDSGSFALARKGGVRNAGTVLAAR
jgi:hypothetical protein